MRVSDEINHAYQVPSISHPKKACRFPGSNIIQRLFVPLLCVCLVCVCVCLTVPGWAAPVMAAAPANPRTGSLKAQLPPCYYEGYLEKRGAKEKVSDHYDMSNTLFDQIIARSGIWDAWHMLHARIVWIWARFDGSAVLILPVCQVTTQMLILLFNSNTNGWTGMNELTLLCAMRYGAVWQLYKCHNSYLSSYFACWVL